MSRNGGDLWREQSQLSTWAEKTREIRLTSSANRMKRSHHKLVRQIISEYLPQSSLHLIRSLVGESYDARRERNKLADFVFRRIGMLTRCELDPFCTPRLFDSFFSSFFLSLLTHFSSMSEIMDLTASDGIEEVLDTSQSVRPPFPLSPSLFIKGGLN